MHAIRTLTVVALVGLLAACTPAPPDAPASDAPVTLNGVPVDVLIADDMAEWTRGLQEYEPLAEGEGMLFVFPDAAPRTFAMKSVSFPIDIVFIAEDDTVSAIEPLDPGELRPVMSPSPSAYVLELPQGWAEESGIEVGDAFVYAE